MNNWRKELSTLINEVIQLDKIYDMDMANANIPTPIDLLDDFIQSLLDKQREELITGETSDGYHTFNELYEFRKLYNATLFNEWSDQGKYSVHKSKRHHDGEECFGGGWFIVMATMPTGQISNHYELKDWDLFHCEEREKADEWDGHTARDVVNRLDNLLKKLEEE